MVIEGRRVDIRMKCRVADEPKTDAEAFDRQETATRDINKLYARLFAAHGYSSTFGAQASMFGAHLASACHSIGMPYEEMKQQLADMITMMLKNADSAYKEQEARSST